MQLSDIAEQTLWTEWVITDLPEEHLYLLLIEDISARKRTTELLIENAGLYRSTFKSGNAIKLLIEPITGQIVDANMAASHYYGYALDMLKSLSMDQISLTPIATRRERARETIERQEGHFETRHRLADSSELALRLEELQKPHSIRWGASLSRTPEFEYPTKTGHSQRRAGQNYPTGHALECRRPTPHGTHHR